jgi:hypothetical protein
MNEIRNLEMFSGALGVLMAATIVYLIRRDHMHVRFSIWWIGVAAIAILFGFFPRIVDQIGGFFGIAYPPILIVILAVAALVLKILFADLERSKMHRDMLRLTQRLLIVEQALKKASSDNRREKGKPEAKPADDGNGTGNSRTES